MPVKVHISPISKMLFVFVSPPDNIKLPPNNGSLTTTLLTGVYPEFVTVMVYVITSPTKETVKGLASFVEV